MIEEKRLGRCLNSGRCGLAGQRGPIPVAADAPFICPECRSELVDFEKTDKTVTAGKRRKLPKMIVVPGVILSLLIAFGLYFELFGEIDLTDMPALAVPVSEIYNPPASVRTGTSTVTYDELAPMLWRGFLTDQRCTDVSRKVGDGKTTIACNAGPAPTVSIFAPDSKIGRAGTVMKTFDVVLTTDNRFVDLPPGDRPAVPDAQGVVTHGDVIAIDALVVIVNPANPLARLSQPELASIFLGTIADYAAVGGRPGRINIVVPTGNARADDRLNAIVPQWLPVTPRARRLATNDEIVAAVLADPQAIGIAELRGTDAARIVRIGPKGGVAVAPTPLGLISGDYPLARPVRAVRFNRNDSPYETGFVRFAQSPPGRDIINAAGFEPVRHDAFAPVPAPDAPASYRGLVAGAARIAADLRFRPASLDLETRSSADLDTVAARLAGLRIAADRIIVIGLADPASPRADEDSASIARQIATMLGERGLHDVASHGLGGIMTVAEPAAGSRNRRVEIWIKPAAAPTTSP